MCTTYMFYVIHREYCRNTYLTIFVFSFTLSAARDPLFHRPDRSAKTKLRQAPVWTDNPNTYTDRNEPVYTVNSKCSGIVVFFFFNKSYVRHFYLIFHIAPSSFYINSWMLIQFPKCSGQIVLFKALPYSRHILSDGLHIVQTFFL